MLNWNDYRYLLAVGSQGSLAAAARKLGVSQPTVGRRLAALTKALDVELLDIYSDGARLSDAGRRVFEQAKILEQQANFIEMSTRSEAGTQTTRIKLAVSEGFARAVLVPLLAKMQNENPHILVDLVVGTRLADMRHSEADIAIRLGDPADEFLIGRKVGTIRFGLYAHQSYIERAGTPETVEDLNAHSIIESVGEIANLKQAVWLRSVAPKARVALSSSSMVSQIDGLVAGMGLLAMPSYLAIDLPGVRQVIPKAFDYAKDVWLLFQPKQKAEKAIRVVLDFLAENIPPRLKALEAGAARLGE